MDNAKTPLMVTLNEAQVASVCNPGLNTIQEMASVAIVFLFVAIL